MLGWDYGTPMVLSDYAFSGYDQGPPGAGGNAIAPPGCGSGTWECEQRWPAIAGMVGWHNAAGAAPVANWWSDGRDAIAFSRGASAWIAINAESTPVTEDFSTGLAAGTYCDVISGAAAAGGCTGATITVGAGGQALVTVPALSAVGIDVAATVSAAADATLSYKYDLGGTWANVEETAGCGFASNRSMSVDGGTQNDTVAAWAGEASC